ncbi:bifunctional folylpolyglutamate synthase/dihydrofolate synthase [Mycoplasmatota bacterium]|nr:bifunctional folylpolyglutamate synthase/dihydrofolate synthase [Mycoplasmatota bacterium]
MFETMEECLEWLYEPREFEIKFDLSRMKKAMELFNNPTNFKAIHIAGTNGKGSTVSFIKNALMSAGYNVGTFISPYVVVFNERITYNNQYISDKDFIKYINTIKLGLLTTDLKISFFEILTIIAFLYFQDMEVDYAIIETGMGGRLDSTNVIDKEVAVITNVGFDHMETLGDTIEKIAKEKLGIVRTNLVTSVSKELRPFVTDYCKVRNVDLVFTDEVYSVSVSDSSTSFIYKNFDVKLSMLGEHQASNASLAIETLLYLRDKSKLIITDEQILKGLRQTFWPGRLEKIRDNVYVDGAHNIDGINTLAKFLDNIDKPKTIIYSCFKDKDYKSMIKELEKHADEIYFTEFDYHRAESAENLYNVSLHENKYLVPDYNDTFNYIKKGNMTVFCGSLYFISLVRQK